MLNIERLIDKAAKELALDRLALRRKNFIRPEQFPYKTGVGVEYDSGDYESRSPRQCVSPITINSSESVIRRGRAASWWGWVSRLSWNPAAAPALKAARAGGAHRRDHGAHRFHSHGQGHETSYAQVIADKMHVSMDHVAIRHGDTLAIQQGVGTFGSRSMVMGGGSMTLAAERVIQKARRIAAHLVEAAPEDMMQADGGFAVAGVPEKKVTWRQIAAAAYGGGFRPVWSQVSRRRYSSIPGAKPGGSARTWPWCVSIAKPASRPSRSSCWWMTAA